MLILLHSPCRERTYPIKAV